MKKFRLPNNHNHAKKSEVHQHYSKHVSRKLSMGQRAADSIAKIGGSWVFIGGFFLFLIIWMTTNSLILLSNGFDKYPYILLNLVLSCLAAIQAPIILMSQNRAAERDRWRSELDYAVNRKAERENQLMQKDLDEIKKQLTRIEKK
ncbi:DUF1003 domain-containing protein [Nanoarchaeota archaeon]